MIDGTDTELLRRYAREDSQEAFTALVHRHLRLVYAAALRRVGGDRQRAEDVCQVVFTDLARHAAALSRRAELVGWLYTAAHFAAAKSVRTERRRAAREQEVQLMNQLLSEAEGKPAGERLQPVVDDAMLDLGDRDREVILMRFFQDRRLADIGRQLGVSEDAARMRVERALERLRVLLAKRRITSTGAALGLILGSQAGAAVPAGLAAAVASGALAGAAAGSGAVGLLGLLKFMTTTKAVAGMAGLMALLAIGSAVYEARAARDLAASLASARAERDDLRTRLTMLRNEGGRAGDAPAVALPKPGPSLAGGFSRVDAPGGRPPASPTGGVLSTVLDHPEMRAAYVQQQVLLARARYDRFFRTAGVSAAQQEQVLQQVKNSNEAELDYRELVRSQGYEGVDVPPEVSAQLGRLQMQIERDHAKALAAILGSEGYRQYQQYGATIPERNAVDQVAVQLYDTDAPLTAPQTDQLRQILQQNQFQPQATPSPANTMNGVFIPADVLRSARRQQSDQGTMMDWRAPVTDAALAAAQAVLTPAQLAALRQLQAQQVARLQLAPPL